MHAIRRKFPLLLGIALSLLLHAAVFFPTFMIAMHAGRQPLPALKAVIDDEDVAVPDIQLPQDDPLAIGIEKSNASTMNWIGFEEYQEHIAALSTHEQPELRLADGGPAASASGAPTTPAPAQPLSQDAAAADQIDPADPVPQDQPLEQSQPQPEPPTETQLARQPASPPPPPAAQPTGLEAIERIMAELAHTPEGVIPASPPPPDEPASQDIPLTPTPAEPRPPAPDQSHDQPIETPPTESSDPKSEITPEPAPQSPAQSPSPAPPPTTAPPAQPQPSPAAPSSGDNPDNNDAGLKSDRESDATGIIEAPPETWKVGKPLAAQGLEILTYKAKISLLTLATATPRNPLYEIQFNRRGSPTHVRLLQSSGERQVDEPLLSSLYRWRAHGKQLEKLGEKETIDVRVRMILVPRPE